VASVPRYWRNIPSYYRLVGSKCRGCGRTWFPPRRCCPICYSRDLELIELPTEGVLEEFTIIRTPPSGFDYYTPYVVGIVKLRDGTRVLTQVVDCDVTELKPGTEVVATFRRVREDGDFGIVMYALKFRPKR